MDLLYRTRAAKIAELANALARPPKASGPQASIIKACARIGGTGRLRGFGTDDDATVFEEAAETAGRYLGPHQLYVPFAMLTDRAMDTTPGSKGGFMVGVETQDAIDVLRPWSVTARAGITIDSGLTSGQALPRITGTSTPYWLGGSTQITAADLTIGENSVTAKTVGAIVTMPVQLARQSNAEAVARREIHSTIGGAVDKAVLAGAGGEQPLGITNTPGIGTTTGASLAQAGVVEMKRKVSAANADDAGVAFVSTPLIRELLEKRERATTGNGFLWDNDRVASRPAYATTDCPSASMICGFWPSVYLGIWGSGFLIDVDRSTHFNSAGLQVRVLVECDVVTLHPAAFCVADSIT
jgi:HK97 family phage major capsid protein